jgi:D-beta-D-heptose 7-phosphate kinase/D-beta-D-heptose 1-phosphate adenosyltransferase
VKKVLVIGDGCKDVFQYGKCERLSPEAPVPVFKPLQAKSNGGMAVNVYENIRSLGVEADIITDSGITKTRYVDEVSNQMLLRVDENDEVENIFLSDLASIKYNLYDAIVISDYDKGFLSETDIVYICNNHSLVFMDTKKKIGNWAYGAEFIKINKKEFDANSENLLKEYNGELIVTLGNEGAMHWMNKFPIEIEHPVRDLTGAGDTFLAALVVEYLQKNNIDDAIIFANRCAAWAVTQKGVCVVDRYKIK